MSDKTAQNLSWIADAIDRLREAVYTTVPDDKPTHIVLTSLEDDKRLLLHTRDLFARDGALPGSAEVWIAGERHNRLRVKESFEDIAKILGVST